MKTTLLSTGLAIITFSFSTLNSSAQAPAIQWQKALGGTGQDWARSIEQTTDGGYIVAGNSHSSNGDVIGHHGNSDGWVIKLTSTGDIDWQRALGGSGYDETNSIKQTADGGYIVAGTSESNDGDVSGNHGFEDLWVVKLSGTGAIEWQRSLGGTGGDLANCIKQTADGGYIVAGISNSNDGDVTGNHFMEDYWVVKLNSTGDIEWQRSLGGTDIDKAYSIKQTTDGGYIIAGETWSNNGDVTGNHGQIDYWVVKLTSTGTIDWQKALGGTWSDFAHSIEQTADGGYIVGGYSNSINGDVTGNHGSFDHWVVKLTSLGVIEWQNSLGGTDFDGAYSIKQTADGGYIVAGFSGSNNGDVTGAQGGDDLWVVKLTSTGTIEWQKAMGGTGYDAAQSIQQTTDGGYIVAGISESNNGDVTGNHGGGDFWVVKLAPSGPTSVENNEQLSDCSIYPNPAKEFIWIETASAPSGVHFRLIDVAGRTVLNGALYQETSRLDVSQLVEGVYLIEIQGFIPQKLVKR